MRVRSLEFDVFVHPEHDPGCFGKSHGFLTPFLRQYGKALVIFDREGCGAEHQSREAIELEVESRLSQNGWEDRTAAIALDPEVEAWVWAGSPLVDELLGWAGREPGLRTWLRSQSYLRGDEAKPARPKEALEHALRLAQKARSAALFQRLAERVSLDRCTDAAFAKFRATLQRWFSTGSSPS